MTDEINHPSHYTHLSVECIDVAEHFNYNMGNALKYIWRADFKGTPIKDLKKSVWYLDREIQRREKSFCASKNLEPPRDYAETVADVVRETRHGGNMLGKK